MAPHQIRLRGPWKYEWLDPQEDPPKTGRLSLPMSWQESFGQQSGRVRFTRKFHCPTNLDSVTRVDLVFTGIGGHGSITLNGQVLQEYFQTEDIAFPLRFSIRHLLEPSNELQVEIEFPPSETQLPGGLAGVVLLEILEMDIE